jgi:hypothetical protein
MGGDRGKRQEESYRKDADAARAAVVESPLEKQIRERAENFFTQAKGSGGIESIDALKPYLDLYKGATSAQKNDRQSTGILNLARGGNSAQSQAYDTYMQYKRQQDAAGQLENAYNATNADMTGQGMNLAQMANSRNMGKAGLAQQAYSTYLNRPKAPPLWQQIAGVAMGGLSAAGTAGGSKGIRGF